ncbi:MAG TPA: endonuclease/exonuclease/phosphatase family protein [Bacteroidales bacterium]|nr:endonuclease/exonuclease/phosphatase family protein [Bacteroidales bacterium]HNS45689.1 endonuclease/exonuclease/phosphatase family protein [Bacteroidales bacterium]
MVEWIKIALWIVLVPLGLIILYLAGVIIWGMITLYAPPPVENSAVPKPCTDNTLPEDTLTLITWNIGYGGLGKEMDFFYEGGVRVRPERDLYDRYRKGILDQLYRLGNIDLFLFQEVDQSAKRSYHDDQVKRIQGVLPGYHTLFAFNYRVRFVPLPFLHPMGDVQSGLLTASRFCPQTASRYAFPPDESWPTRLFMLQRCFLLTELTVNDQPLTLINTHHSAYDETGEAKSMQLEILRKEATDAYQKGHYVIAGGDWNQNPPDFRQERITSGDALKTIDPLIPAGLMPSGWKWVYDPSQPTNRDVDKPYAKGATRTTLIDFFLVSPNVEVVEVKTVPVHFEFTDHQPVVLKVRLIRD